MTDITPERLEEIRVREEAAEQATVPLLIWARWYYEDIPDLLAHIESLEARVEEMQRLLNEQTGVIQAQAGLRGRDR